VPAEKQRVLYSNKVSSEKRDDILEITTTLLAKRVSGPKLFGRTYTTYYIYYCHKMPRTISMTAVGKKVLNFLLSFSFYTVTA
jgi:hypothetical protein